MYEVIDDPENSFDEEDLHANYPYKKPLHFLEFKPGQFQKASETPIRFQPSSEGQGVAKFYREVVGLPTEPLQQETCPDCGIPYDSSFEEHQLSVGHMFNTVEKPPQSFGIPANNRGFQMLLDTGWSEQDGLGKHLDGETAPVPVRMKSDRKGLGHRPGPARITHILRPPAPPPPKPSAAERRRQTKQRLALDGAVTRDLRKYLASGSELNPLESDVYQLTQLEPAPRRRKTRTG